MSHTDVNDLEQIRGVTYAYSYAMDSWDVDELINVFTDDAVMDASAFGFGEIVGHAALRAFFTENRGKAAATFHQMSHHVIDVNGDTAAGKCYGRNILVDGDGTLHETVGIYHDLFARMNGNWKIKRRRWSPYDIDFTQR